jgi:hypothetical protein
MGDQPTDKIDSPNAFSVKFRIKTICNTNISENVYLLNFKFPAKSWTPIFVWTGPYEKSEARAFGGVGVISENSGGR